MKINKVTMNTKEFRKDFILEIDGVEFTLEELINIKKGNNSLEFNEDNVRKIAEKCFTNDIWYKYILVQYKNTGIEHRRDVNKDNFIDDVVRACVDGKVVHLTKEWHRGMSKSHFIDEMSRIFKIPVFREYKNQCVNNCYIYYTHVDQLKGIGFDKVLVDECNIETVNKIRKMGITPIGFACTYKKYELI